MFAMFIMGALIGVVLFSALVALFDEVCDHDWFRIFVIVGLLAILTSQWVIAMAMERQARQYMSLTEERSNGK